MLLMKKLKSFLFLLLICPVCHLQAQDVIRVKKPDTCGINLVADTTLIDQTVKLSLFKISGLASQKELDEVRSKSGFQLDDLLTVSMDSVCRYVKLIKETKKHRLVEVKIIHIDEPSVTIYKYAMITLVYVEKNRPKEPEKNGDTKEDLPAGKAGTEEDPENTDTTENTASQEE